jgi:alanyl-tRNA synthetase
VASGVRRIEAVTGKAALEYLNEKAALLAETAKTLKTSEKEVPAAVDKLLGEKKALEKQVEEAAAAREKADAAKLLAAVTKVGDTPVICGKVNAESMDELRDIADIVS